MGTNDGQPVVSASEETVVMATDPQIQAATTAAYVAGRIADAIASYEYLIETLDTEAKYDAALAALQASKAFYVNPSTGQAYGGTVALQTLLNAKQKILYNGEIVYSGVVSATMAVTMKAIVQQVYQNADGLLEAQMGTILENFSRRMNQRIGMKAKMDRVAAGARDATLAAYATRVKRSDYRAGQNRLVGAVFRALQRSEWAIGTSDGVLFGNRAVLDAEAANWRRLNFGAGAAGKSKNPSTGPMYFSLDPRAPGAHGTLVFGRFGLAPQPSPAFTLPPGVFVGPEGQIIPHGRGRGEPFYTRKWYIDAFRSGLDARPLTQKQERAFNRPFSGRKTTHFFNPVNGNVHSMFSKEKTNQELARAKGGQGGAQRLNTRGIVGYHFMDAGVAYMRGGAHNYSLPKAYAEIFNEWFREATRDAGPLRNR